MKVKRSRINLGTNAWTMLNGERSAYDSSLFRGNVRFITSQKDQPSLRAIFREFKEHGLGASRTKFISPTANLHAPRLTFISTFARVLGVPTWLLLSEDIETDWRNLPKKNT